MGDFVSGLIGGLTDLFWGIIGFITNLIVTPVQAFLEPISRAINFTFIDHYFSLAQDAMFTIGSYIGGFDQAFPMLHIADVTRLFSFAFLLGLLIFVVIKIIDWLPFT